MHLHDRRVFMAAQFRFDSRLSTSQWETSLQSNTVSHWLGTNLESTLTVDYHMTINYTPEHQPFWQDMVIWLRFMFGDLPFAWLNFKSNYFEFKSGGLLTCCAWNWAKILNCFCVDCFQEKDPPKPTLSVIYNGLNEVLLRYNTVNYL